MSQEPNTSAGVSLHCPICGTPEKIKVPSIFECSKCHNVTEVAFGTDRMTGPVVWLAGNSQLPD
jgi:hypothetical protein